MALTDRELYMHNEQLYIAASDNLFKRYYPSLQRIEEVIYSNQGEPTREQRKQHALLSLLAASYCVDDVLALLYINNAKQAIAHLTVDELLNTFTLDKRSDKQYQQCLRRINHIVVKNKICREMGVYAPMMLEVVALANKDVARMLTYEAVHLQRHRVMGW